MSCKFLNLGIFRELPCYNGINIYSCQLSNGSYVPEGSFVDLSAAEIPRSSDVVFIVEAKPCNANLKQSKSIMSVVDSIEEQLKAAGIANNR